MWAFYESYDPARHILYFDLVSAPVAVSCHPGNGDPRLLEIFEEVDEARRFADGYLKALAYDEDQAIRSVQCGPNRMCGCGGPGKPCYLRLDAYRCGEREG